MSEHTPGPWYVPKGEPFCVDAVIPDKDKTDHDFRIAKTYASPFSPNQEQAKANAALIARAPEMVAEIDRLRAEVEALREHRGQLADDKLRAKAELASLRARVAELEASRAELVDIARRYVDGCEDTFIDPEEMSAECVALWKDARAAIAKATGEGACSD